MQRVEALLEQLIESSYASPVKKSSPPSKLEQSGYYTPASDYQAPGPVSAPSEPCVSTSQFTIPVPTSEFTIPIPTSEFTVSSKEESVKLSEELLKAFPSQDDINTFCKSDYLTTFYCHEIFTKSIDPHEHEAFDLVNSFAKIPDPITTPPILMAKRMILLACFLQYLRSQNLCILREDPATIMNRLVETAARFVTSNENIVGSVEGLECIILEGVFQANGGNLRRAWITFRKAMVMAQLMRMDLPNPPPVKTLEANSKQNPKFMWFRIVYMDSYLSLMLGLPHGGGETNMENDVPGETANCKLERTQALIARQIIDRNRCGTSFQDFTATRLIDQKLLDAAKSLPDNFWLPPNFAPLQPNTPEAFWVMMRLCDQLHHYNLVHLLHLPYLCSDKVSSYHTYSKVTCVNASREILSRVIAFRNFTNTTTTNCRCLGTL
jgi:hypothetical protein